MPNPRADVPVGLAQAAIGYLLAALGPYVVLLAAELHRPRAELTWLTSTFGGGLIAVAVLGPLAMRLGPGMVLRIAAVALALGAAAEALVPSLPVVGAGAILIGFGGAGIVLATPALLTGPTAAARLTRVNGVGSATGICAPLLIGALEQADWPGRLALLVPLPALIILAACPIPAASAVRAGLVRLPVRLAATGWTRIVLAVSAEFCFSIWGVARIRDAGATLALAATLSAAFPIGMAAGRLAGPRVAAHRHAATVAILTALAGTGIVCAATHPWSVAIGLGIAGLGIAVLYPVMLARLVGTPGLAPPHAAAVGALASGTAILTAPTLLAAVSTVVDIRLAFLLPLPVLAALLLLSRMPRRA